MLVLISKENIFNKNYYLEYFKQRGMESLAELEREIGRNQHKELAAGLNKACQESLRIVVNVLLGMKLSQEEQLSAILLVHYSTYVVMLELRNQVWQYEYMAFSRRIGELWEAFIRVVFEYAPNQLQHFVPPLFVDVRQKLKSEIVQYIQTLPLAAQQSQELLEYYEKVWLLVDSGEINLQLDLHIQIAQQKINIDLKSGFGSNEKGNTNRLLMVATIYQNLELGYENILLVRALEDQNNHYFRVLKNSSVWSAFCGADAYAKIGQLTGFDIALWIQTNIDWQKDFSALTVKQLQNNQLLSYLEW